MKQIAARAGLTKRTVYNNYGDKDALFTQIVTDVLSYAETFTRRLHEEFDSVTAASLRSALDDLARRLALGIVRPEVLAIRCLLIGEARSFPALGSEYFDRAPGQVLDALASRFAHLSGRRLLRARPSNLRISSSVRRSTARCSQGRRRRRRRSPRPQAMV